MALAAVCLLACRPPTPQKTTTPTTHSWPSEAKLRRHFGGRSATFVLFDAQRRRWLRVDAKRAARRYAPCSTFKIPHSLIALSSGVAADTAYAIAWDRQRDPAKSWWPKTWRRDQTMATALPNSVVWYYRELARRIGATRMRAYLAKLRYGNEDISGGLDRFWLGSSLRISANEQVAFLRRFRRDDLAGIPRAATRALRPLLVLERGSGWTLSGKTGACDARDGGSLGWLVGYLERGERLYVYALNVSGRSFREVLPLRRALVKAMLTELGLLSPPKS
jgi:beta-lactamase class D